MMLDIPCERDLGAGLAAHEIGEPTRQLALLRLGKSGIEHCRDGDAEHPVAQKLEPLVGGVALGRGADMGQGENEEALIAKAVAEPCFEAGEIVPPAAIGRGACLRHRTGLNSRFQRTVQGHSQIFQAGWPSPLEKKISSARPMRLTAGT